MTIPAFSAGPVKRSLSTGFDRVERLKFSAPRIVQALALDLKPSGGRLRGNTPWRSDSDSGAFSLDPATGGWSDFARDERGDVLDLVARVQNLADRAADRFPEVLAEAEALAGLRAFTPGAKPDAAILRRRRTEREAALRDAAPDDGLIKGAWKRLSNAEAEERFAFLARTLDPEARAFFAEGYSIPELPLAPPAVAPFLYPGTIKEVDPLGSKPSRIGYLYAARDERGALEAVKFKTRARTQSRGKRASRGVWGNKAALIGAELLRLAEGGTVVVTAGEEKALAGNAWALRAGANVVFVASLFGEGFHNAHGPKQARRIVEAGPARIVLAGDADAAGAKFNAAWRDGLFATDWPLERIGALEWPEGAPAGFDVNDALAAEGPDALFARIQSAPAMPPPETPKQAAPKGAALRLRLDLEPGEAFAMPQTTPCPLPWIRRLLRERLESLPLGGKLLVATGPGTGKTFAASRAAAAELRRRTLGPDAKPPRVLVAAPKALWSEWRSALEDAGIASGRIADLPGRDCSTCRLSGIANALRSKYQNVARLLCGRGMKDPDNGEKAQGGEAWTPCGGIARSQAAERGVKAAPGCQGAEGQTGYVHLYEEARRAAVVLTTPERLFGAGFDRLEGDWPFGLLIVDEGIDRHLLPSRLIPERAAEVWQSRLAELGAERSKTRRQRAAERSKRAGEIVRLGRALRAESNPSERETLREALGLLRQKDNSAAAKDGADASAERRDASLAVWLERLLEGAGPERAALLKADGLRRRKENASGQGARVAERDAWLAWAAKEWPEEAAPGERLAEEVGDLLDGLRDSPGALSFELARSAGADAPHAGFAPYFRALARDLAEPAAEPWLCATGSAERPVWEIGEPCAEALAVLGDPARRVAVLDATPSPAARSILANFGFEGFEAEAADQTRVVQVRGLLNGTGHLAEPKEPAEGSDAKTRERHEKKRAAWEQARRAHETRLAEIVAGLGFDPSEAGLVTHKGRAEGFERLRADLTFGAHRGSNALKDAPSLIVDGRSEPPSEVLARERRLLSRTLAALGAPEPPLHPLIARSRPDDRPGLESPRRFVQYLGAEGEPCAVSVPSTGDDAVDSWALSRREREMLQCLGRLRGPDRAQREEEPGLVVIVTDDPLGLIPVDAFREWREANPAFEAAAAELREQRQAEAAERDAERLESVKRAIAELRLGGRTPTRNAVAKKAGLAPRTMLRALERRGVSLAELLDEGLPSNEKVRPEKWGTLAIIRIEGATGAPPISEQRGIARASAPLEERCAGPEPVQLSPSRSLSLGSERGPLPGALAEAAALADREALEAAEGVAIQAKGAEREAWSKDAGQAAVLAASRPVLADWLPRLLGLGLDPKRDGSEALRAAVTASSGPSVRALLAVGASPTMPGRGGMASALSLARWRSAPGEIDGPLVAAALAEFGADGPEAERLERIGERLADPDQRAALAEWFASEAGRQPGGAGESLRLAVDAIRRGEAQASRPALGRGAGRLRARSVASKDASGAFGEAAKLSAEALTFMAASAGGQAPGQRDWA